MPNISVILKNAMSLDVHDRATLAEKLLASLEQLSDKEAERIWADEAQRRLKEYRAGRSKASPRRKPVGKPKNYSGEARPVARSGRGRTSQ